MTGRETRRFWKAILFATSCGVLVACSDDSVVGTNRSDDALVDSLVAQGFRRDQIVDHGDYFVIENDIVIRKHAVGRRSFSNETPPRKWGIRGPSMQWQTFTVVTLAKARHIRVDVSGAASSWQTAIRSAMTEWNQVTPGASVEFVEEVPADIQFVMTDDLPADVIAQADFPQNGVPGGIIRIHNTFTNNPNYGPSEKTLVMVHEMGHTIGLRHTDMRTRAQPEAFDGATQILGTPTTDGASVMNHAIGGLPWSGFSTYDKLSAFILYPPDAPSASVSYPNGVPTFSWSPPTDAVRYRIGRGSYFYTWYEPSQDYMSSSGVSFEPYTYATTATYPGATYTGVSRCEWYYGGPANSYQEDWWAFDVQYPINVETGVGGVGSTVGPAEVLSC